MGEDIKEEEAKILKYIDDSKAIRGIKNEDDVEQFQEALNKLYSWQERNNMSFNASKFQLVRFGPNETIKEDTTLFTNNMSEVIVPEETVRDLGVQIDSGATFGPQRKLAIAKAKQKAGWVLRTFGCGDQHLMVTLWKSLIRPHLDYCS